MLANDRDNMICPLAGTTCPGISNCAPAVYRAVQESDDRVECPIISALQSMSMIAAYYSTMLAEVYESQDVDKEEEKTAHLTPDEAERMRVLQRLGLADDDKGIA